MSSSRDRPQKNSEQDASRNKKEIIYDRTDCRLFICTNAANLDDADRKQKFEVESWQKIDIVHCDCKKKKR